MKCFEIELKDIYRNLGEGGKNPRLVCYLPYNLKEMNRENDKRPCMLVCPGGGYGMCSEREAEPIALRFLSLGFNVFVLYYSVSPNRYPTQLCEVAAAFEEIYKNADEWNCDTEKVGIIGFSAGGHLAAHYSNAYGCEDVRKVFEHSKRPDFCVLGYPVITTEETTTHRGSIENLVGKFPTGEEANRFSCEKLVSANTPPTFIWHTVEDEAVPVKNSIYYAASLADNGVPFTMHLYPYGCHGLSTCDSLTNDEEKLNKKNLLASGWIDDFKKWFDVTIA